jgi:hypothetical protein
MVVALDLHGHGQSAPDVHDAGILPGTLKHPLARRRKELQARPRMLVATVLAPHERIHGQLYMGGLTPLDRTDMLVFAAGETEFLEELRHLRLRV